ncbi:MAG: HAMP domain-containing histidine kinase [Oscillospiraceae bacterium]|jgi:signal transduction histidine kinase|nr:HAMP domain-containing histidine kinase [Oscillospiraceae bacterium]MBQ3803089.1 HAMP domain-containing histidine kinase [Oscillospiraceae bacterium]MBQ6428787.1 HAMP domain-containing histidine kinase [Oscillospiraceae bacterium]MBR2703769.1 HAMP domain-containing histidine kinase [Oscillospiraceae bacterium]MBR2799354.1 HAMP domain-containing histidine kinase [Oscillospiraceae bacterium]
MFKYLRTQLLASIIAALILMLLSIWAITREYMIFAVCILVLVCFYMIYLLFWFWKNISEPIDRLTGFAAQIASGSYGSKLEERSDNEIGNLTDAINDMSEKVALAEKARTDFISQVSHELRTPLTAITGWSETIAYDPAVQGDSLRGLNIISKEAERLTGMVTELLEFTRIQDGRFNLRIETVDIAEELEDAIFTYGKLMKQAGMDVHYDPPAKELPLIPGDPERLKQVFLNLLDNAMIHGGEGKMIDVSLGRDGNYVKIVFRDYGSGIPDAELPHVKEKFYKGSSKNRGTGIGLAVCDEIITRHKGRMEIRNADGGGCMVQLYLPIRSS